MENDRSNYFEYRVSFYDEVDQTMETRYGVVYGKTYAELAAALDSYYGTSAIENLQVWALYPDSVYEFNGFDNNLEVDSIQIKD